ncbi:hypothetical protein [Chryseobacterium flavum]|uniref:hypothetical protein n=1 Tax=Chryseobacterium flavum TaxID=415851 RepID=UPI0028B09AE3|nr:hypothetical protein [Chryseobacterium flavum]
MKQKIPKEFELLNKLRDSSGYKITQKINSFSLSTYIFKQNYNQLINQINLQTKPENSKEIHSNENREKLRKVQLETLRFLHNFLASAQSLIDHTRVFVNDLYNDDLLFKEEFSEKIQQTFTNDEVSVFIKDFRQFLQHFKMPNISTVTNLKIKDEKIERKVMISVQDLNQFSGWKALSKKFISKYKDKIDLSMVATEYFNIVNNFYNWFSERQELLHQDEFAEMENTRTEMINVGIEETIKRFIKNKNITKESFDISITQFMNEGEKNAFIKWNQDSKFQYILSICRNKKIKLHQKEILIFLKKYRR